MSYYKAFLSFLSAVLCFLISAALISLWALLLLNFFPKLLSEFSTFAIISSNFLTVSLTLCCRRYSSLSYFFLEQFDIEVGDATVFIGVCGHTNKSFFRWSYITMGVSKLEILRGCESRKSWLIFDIFWLVIMLCYRWSQDKSLKKIKIFEVSGSSVILNTAELVAD